MEKGCPNRSVAAYSFESSKGREAAKARLVAYAENTMARKGIASATLVMTENDIVIGARNLESGKL